MSSRSMDFMGWIRNGMVSLWGSLTLRISPFLFMLTLLLPQSALLLPQSGMAAQSVALYHIASVKVSVPLTSGGNLRRIGLKRAKKKALDYLLQRMLTSTDRSRLQEFRKALRKDITSLVQRASVISEVRHANVLRLVVDVTFSEQKMRDAFVTEEVLYSETLYPSILFLLREKISGADGRSAFRPSEPLLQKVVINAAHAYGLSVTTPLGDMPDMTHLSWQKAVAGDQVLLKWAYNRYGVDNVLALAITLQKRDSQTTGVKAQLLGNYQVVSQEVVSTGLTANASTRRDCSKSQRANLHDCLYTAVTQRLFQQMMDLWITAHAIQPSLHHLVQLRLFHSPVMSKYAEFVRGLRAIPGVSDVTFVNSKARESTIQVAFQGTDEQLRHAVTRLGAEVVVPSQVPVVAPGQALAPADPYRMPAPVTRNGALAANRHQPDRFTSVLAVPASTPPPVAGTVQGVGTEAATNTPPPTKIQLRLR